MKLQVDKAKYGSGGNYLSNEFFFRVAKLREEWLKQQPEGTKKPTGHFHIAQIQAGNEDFDLSNTRDLLNIVKQAITRGVNAL